VLRSDVQDCGRKMWTCIRLDLIRLLIAGSEMDLSFKRIEVRMVLSMTAARRGMLKWWSGSKRMTEAFWPESGDEENVGGRMAWAVIR
jgi:hypothetical protein